VPGSLTGHVKQTLQDSCVKQNRKKCVQQLLSVGSRDLPPFLSALVGCRVDGSMLWLDDVGGIQRHWPHALQCLAACRGFCAAQQLQLHKFCSVMVTVHGPGHHMHMQRTSQGKLA
jgi:hypothetical protein